MPDPTSKPRNKGNVKEQKRRANQRVRQRQVAMARENRPSVIRCRHCGVDVQVNKRGRIPLMCPDCCAAKNRVQRLDEPLAPRAREYPRKARERMTRYVQSVMGRAPVPEGENRSVFEFLKIAWALGSRWHVDHITPVSRGGDNSLDNLQVLRDVVNHAKNSHTEEEFLAELDATGCPRSWYYSNRLLARDVLVEA